MRATGADAMRYRKLGKTDLHVSEIGFGTWGLGGDAYGPIEDVQSVSCLHAALDRGINFFDTSDLYGSGHSEEVVGEAFHDRRSRALIATKGGLLPHAGFHMPVDFSSSYIRKAFEASLRRLKTDYVDLYQLHSPEIDHLTDHPDVLDTLRDLKSEGKVRAIGLSARSPKDALAALALFPFEVVQVNFNLIDHRAQDDGLFAYAEANGVSVIARTPLCFGYLTGRLTGSKTDFSGRDHRANWPDDQLERWATAPGLFNPPIARRGCTPAQLALMFCLSPRAVVTTIPGMMQIKEVEENAAIASMIPLSEAELAEIRQIYLGNNFYDKTAKSRGQQ
jgi:aryl-alcohol dehydrogenase-like predicted oxidoreductase